MVDIDSYESVERRWYNMILSGFFGTKESARQYAIRAGVDMVFMDDVLDSKMIDKHFDNWPESILNRKEF